MKRLKRCMWMIGLILLLPCAAGPAQAQGPEEGWQVYTNANYVRSLALEGGGALGGGYTWAATAGGVVCYSTSQQVRFTTADGLARDRVNDVAMDGMGWWWFGTHGGGVSVLDDGGTPFNQGDDTWATFTTADGLAHNRVAVIIEDRRGFHWFGTEGGGVSVLSDHDTPSNKQDDTWNTFTSADELASNDVDTLVEGGRGQLWFGTYGGGVSVLDDGDTPFDKQDDTWITFTTADGLANGHVPAIARDDWGRWWFGTWGGGVSMLDDGGTPFDKVDDTWATFTTTHGLVSDYVRAVAVGSGGRLWFGTLSGVSVLDDGGTPFSKSDDTWTTFTTADGLADDGVYDIAVDHEGRLWFGTWDEISVLDDGGTPFYKDDDNWTTFTTATDLQSIYVRAIAVDQGGRWWFGTWEGGVSVLDDGDTPFDRYDDIWTVFTTADGLTHNRIYAAAVDGQGMWWFGTWNGVSVLNNKGTPFNKNDDSWITFTAADGLGSNGVENMALDNHGMWWFGTWSGVSILNNKGTPFNKNDDSWITFSTADGLAGNDVHALALDDRGRWWFGTYGGGASMLDDGDTPFTKQDDTWITFTSADGLADNEVNAIVVAPDSTLWFGTWCGGVSVLDHGDTPLYKGDDTWTAFTESDGLVDNCVRSIAVDDRGRWWFGTASGASVLDHGGTPFDKRDDTWTTFTIADGLPDDNVYAITVGGAGQVWFGTWGGGVGELVDTVAPTSSGRSPAYANGKISLPWSAHDGASGVFRATLWAKYENSGTWSKTTLSQRGQTSGTFTYTPTHGNGTYYFATVAEDWMGNVEANPTGGGDCSISIGSRYVYLPLGLRDYLAYFEGPWESEDNDSYTAANGPLRAGRDYYGYPDDAKDYFSIYLRAGGNITIDLTNHTGQGTQLQLFYQSVSDRVAYVLNPPYHIEYPGLAGLYYIYIYTASGYNNANPYTLRVTY